MALTVENVGVVRVVTLEGRIVTEAAQDLKRDFDAYAEGDAGPTLLDMGAVLYVCSYLVGVLVALRSRLSARGFPVAFAGLDPKHRFVLRVAGLEELFEYHATREEGIAALANGRPGP